MLKMTTKWKRFECSRGRLARPMVSSVVAAVGFMPLTATAQAQTAAPQASSEQSTEVAAAPFVRRLDTIPQMTGSEKHPQALPRRTGVDPATKARAAQIPANPKLASPPPVRLQPLKTPGNSLLFNSTGEAACGNVKPAENGAFYGQGRWGDYTAVAPAGLAPSGVNGANPKMYFAGMYARSSGNWGTAIGVNGYNSITQP